MLPTMVLATDVESGWTGTAGTTGTMAYQYNDGSYQGSGFEYETGGNFNIHGTFNSNWLQTTYLDRGYYTFFQNDLVISELDAQKMKVDGNPQNTLIAGVTLDVDMKLVYDGAGLQVVYTVANNSASQITYSLGSIADVYIGADDDATVTCLNNDKGDKIGFSMVSTMDSDKDGMGEYPHFNFFAADVPDMVTDVDTFWIGFYAEAPGNLYTDNRTDFSGDDSGMAYSWKGETLVPGTTATYSVLFSIGGNDSVNITKSNINYITEMLSGMESDHNYEITVDGIVYKLKPAADDTIPLAGTDLNGQNYNFIGKTLSIVRKGNTGELDTLPKSFAVAGRPSVKQLTVNDVATTGNSIIITPQSGAEYSIDGGATWRKPDISTGKVAFGGLTKGSLVTIITRTAATNSAPASQPSSGIAVTVTSAPKIPTTGYRANLGLWIGILLLTGVGFGTSIGLSRRKHKV